MSDLAVLCTALAAAGGAWAARPVPLPIAVGVVALAVGWRRPWLLVLGAGLLTCSLGARAWAGLDGVEARPVRATAVLVSDPVDFHGAVRVDVRLDGRRYEAWARGGAATALRDRLAGERVVVAGDVAPAPPGARSRLARRHVAGRLTVTAVLGWSPGDPASRLANGLRRTLDRGATPLEPGTRALLAGFLLGDRRGQSDEVEDDFRASGLSHLLAVSGQNVAFVLLLARPLLSRLPLRSRLIATVGVIGMFALVTRWEPSVLRASAMATLTAVAFTSGRPAPPLRLLALAVTVLLAVDPMLVGSVAFLLSVGATAGIVVLAPAVAARLPGPRWLREPLAVTLAAQVGVAPVLIPVFGGLPLATVPANLLAAPAAGPVTIWGLPAGLLAGVLGSPAADVLHVPTRLLVGWIAAVARVSARLPVGELHGHHAVALAVLATGAAAAIALGRRWWATGAVAVATVAVMLAAMVGGGGPPGGATVAGGAVLWRGSHATVLELDAPDTGQLLAGLRAAGVRRVDVVVVRRGTAARTADAVLAVRDRLAPRLVLGPEGHRIRGAVVPAAGAVVVVGDLEVVVESIRPVLDVEVRRVASPP